MEAEIEYPTERGHAYSQEEAQMPSLSPRDMILLLCAHT